MTWKNKARSLRLLVAGAIVVCPSLRQAEATGLPATCHPPANLQKVLTDKPSAPVYDAVGAWFAQNQQLPCALAAFQEAVRLEPQSVEAHYDYGLVLVQADRLKLAEHEFRTAVRLQPKLLQGHLSLGSVLLDSEKPELAEAEFREALKVDPKSVFALDHLAQALAAERRYDAALRYWREALSYQPESTDIRLSLAVATYEDAVAKQGMGIPGGHESGTNEAIRVLTELTRDKPDLKAAHFTLGNIYARESRFREAADAYSATVKLDPNDTVSLLAQVKALDTISAYQQALVPAQEYVRRKPADPEGHLLLGAVYRGLGEYGKARPELERAAQASPNDFQSQYQLGFVLARLDRPQEALPYLKRAVQIKPNDSSAQFQLAAVLRSVGEAKEAGEVSAGFKKTKEQDFKQSQFAAQGNKANQYLQSGQPEQAAAIYREMLESDGANAHTYYNLAIALQAGKDAQGARQALTKAIELDPKMALAHAELGRMSLAQGDVANAKRHLELAIESDPQLVAALGNLGVIYAQSGDIGRAESLFRRAVEDDAGYAQGHLNLGLILAQQGKYVDAETELGKAMELTPDDGRVLSALGKVKCRTGKNQEGIGLLERVVAKDPNSAAAHLDLAIAQADSYDLKRALVEADASVRLAPQAAATHFNRGALLSDLGRPAEARTDLETAARLAPNMPQPHYYLALIDKQAGNYQSAIDHLQMVVRQETRNVMAWHLLGQCLDAESKQDEAIRAWKQALAVNPQYTQSLWSLGHAIRQSEPQESARLLKQFDEIQRRNKVLDRAGTSNNEAVAMMQGGDWDGAAKKLKEALQVCAGCTANRDLHKNLGLVYCHAGDIDAGEKELRVAEASQPGDPDVAKALRLIAQVRSKQTASGAQVR